MYRALIVGAGRIGAGFNWSDDAYTHAGAYKALPERVKLIGFVEPDESRAVAAQAKWGIPSWDRLESSLQNMKPDIVSVCTPPEDQIRVLPILEAFPSVKAIWCEKPYMGYACKKPVQVNYMRRADDLHRRIAQGWPGGRLIVYGKDDLTTRCHFEDLAVFWKAALDYRPFQGPCAYVFENAAGALWFDNGGVNAAVCFRSMLGNLLDHLDTGTPLWSPANAA